MSSADSDRMPWVLALGVVLTALLCWGLFVLLVWFAVVGPAPSPARPAVSAPASGETFLKTGLDVAAPFCRTAGLSSVKAVSAPVSAVFLCPDCDTMPKFAGVGVVGGDKIPAPAGKSATGSFNTRENPGAGLGAISPKVKVMKKQTKGAARPGKSAAPRAKASMVKVKVALSDWAHAQLIKRHFGLPIQRTVRSLAWDAVMDEGGLHDALVESSPHMEVAERAARRGLVSVHVLELPAGLASDLAARGKRELGFSLGATLSYLLSSAALVDTSCGKHSRAADWWKTEGRAEA